jgi:hypothetical protein
LAEHFWIYEESLSGLAAYCYSRCLISAQSESFSAPNAGQIAKGANSIASYHGTSGPVQVTYPDLMYGGPQQPSFVNSTVSLMGIEHYKDLNGGTPNCVSITPLVRLHFDIMP